MIGPFPPMSLPGSVRIGPGTLPLRALPPYELAAAILDDPSHLLERLTPPDQWAGITAAADSPDFPILDRPHLIAAGAGVAARLCGQEPSILGWRWSIRLCSILFGEAPGGWSLVVDRGIDPSTAPLWVSCAAAWSTLTRQADKDKREQLKRDFAVPFDSEWLWSWAMPRLLDPVEADRRSAVARRRRALKNVRAVGALRSGQLR